MMRAENLRFSYKFKEILKDVSLKVDRGEMTFILGPNGSGKTTLLKCLNGILKPKGAVYVENFDLKELTPKDLAKLFGYVPQRSDVTQLTVFDTILLGRRPHVGWKPGERDLKVVENIIKIFRLEDLALRRLTELSGGELQKVMIARALAQEPKILLLDEPTNNLDIKSQIEIMKIIRRIVKERKISAIITTHDLNLSAIFADKIVLMKDGRVFACGDLDILNKEIVKAVYGIDVDVFRLNGRLVIMPVV